MIRAVFLMVLFLTACTDVFHYISFDHEGQSLQVIRIAVNKNYLQENPQIFDELSAMRGFRLRTDHYLISSSPLETEQDFGFEIRATSKKGYLASKRDGIIPAKERFGFSISLDPVLQEPASEEDFPWLSGARYRIVLSKNGLSGALRRIDVSGYGSLKSSLTVSEFDSFYMIEFPISTWLLHPNPTKIDFYIP